MAGSSNNIILSGNTTEPIEGGKLDTVIREIKDKSRSGEIFFSGTSSGIFLIGGKLDTVMRLSCGCEVYLWRVLVVTALQLRSSQPVVCPVHMKEHDYSNNTAFHQWGEGFLSEMAIMYPNVFSHI